MESLDSLCRIADPLADDTIAKIVGPWPEGSATLDAAALGRIASVNRLIASWPENGALPTWSPPNDADPTVADALIEYVRQGCELPEWADATKVERAEQIFMDEGPLSCTLLFCASLPQCYVMPNLADVLHIAGQLEAHTEHRVRQTAAMIFPVMMRGGLMGPQGMGLAQILKVRLIHATIRHLILHGNPGTVRGPVPATRRALVTGMHDALMQHGWDVDTQGVPCNQLELAYTLLTFHYIFLRGMRTLGQALSEDDESCYLHAWNVMGHVLGIRSDLMPKDMPYAEQLFQRMLLTTRATTSQPDVRPALGQALMNTLAKTLMLPVFRQLPVPLTQWLLGSDTARQIGLGDVNWMTRSLFFMLRTLVMSVDRFGRLFTQQFSISRMVTRVLGYHFLTRLLMDQTRPLALPENVLQNLHQTIGGWGDDKRAHAWVNRLEDRWTQKGRW